MDWYETAIHTYNLEPSLYISHISNLNLKESISTLNTHFSHNSFFDTHLSSADFFLASQIMSSAYMSRIVHSKNGPVHLCRWFTHIVSLHPSTSSKREPSNDSRLSSALRNNDTETFMQLLTKIDIHCKDSGGACAIHIASKMGNLQAIDALISLGVSIETEDHEGATPLFYAIRHGSVPTIKHLVGLNANLFHKENQGRSALYWACSSEKLDVVEYLLTLNVEVNAESRLRRSALSLSLIHI